jgi:hypothetical protein
MKKQSQHRRSSKLVLNLEQLRSLSLVGGLKITDGTNASHCLPGPCEDNTAHFCQA